MSHETSITIPDLPIHIWSVAVILLPALVCLGTDLPASVVSLIETHAKQAAGVGAGYINRPAIPVANAAGCGAGHDLTGL